jgi:hypothetical protein
VSSLRHLPLPESVKRGPFQIRLKFGKQAYWVAEVQIGEEAAEVAKTLRELAAQVEARSKWRCAGGMVEQKTTDRGAARDRALRLGSLFAALQHHPRVNTWVVRDSFGIGRPQLSHLNESCTRIL